MKLYIVRHGRSLDHDADRRQTPDSVLGETGKKQAKLVAKRFKNKEKYDVIINSILTSRWPRAYETAKSIGNALDKKVEIFEGIHEKEQDASIYGLDVNSIEFKDYVAEIKKYGSDLDWKYRGGGESLRMVSHGNFIRCFITFCILGKNYDDKTFYKLFDSIHFENTGISLIGYEEERKSWNIIYLNDQSHLEKLYEKA